MNILVTGANGQLGNEMRIVAKKSKNRYFFADITPHPSEPTLMLDITNAAQINSIVSENNIDIIINCAAYTNVDAAEDNVDLARVLNAEAPRLLANAMQQRGGLLVHISTDYVFGKEVYNTPCTETMKGTPTGVYGETKLEGENNIIASNCRYVIIRTAWLYSEFGKNFLKTMLSLTSTKDSLKVVADQVGTPTYALDLANAIFEIVENHASEDISGIYHYSNLGVCSWYDFAQHIADYAGNTHCHISPCRSSEFPSKVLRPAYSVLDKTKISTTFALTIPYWTHSLQLCMANMK